MVEWIQGPIEPLRHALGLIFSKMIRNSTRESELQVEYWRHRPKKEDTAAEAPKSEPNCPEKVPERGCGLSTENGLKPSLTLADL